MDKNFLGGQNIEEYDDLVDFLISEYASDRLIFMYCIVEGGEVLYSNLKHGLQYEEHYWTQGWSLLNSSSWLDKLPLPKRHAKKFNQSYKDSCKKNVLMLDYYELPQGT